jgi:hypothetical protein
MRKLGKVFGICSDEIDLSRVRESYRPSSQDGQQNHANG